LELYQKFVDKALPMVNNIHKDIVRPFANLLQTVIFLYKETTTVGDIGAAVEGLIGEGATRLSEEEMKREIEKYSWKESLKHNKKLTTMVQSQRPGYRGMSNIGNCKCESMQLAT
jgi:tetrahydromethanopterin S-methyltransferase subunit A